MAVVRKKGASGQSDLDVLSRLFVPVVLLSQDGVYTGHPRSHQQHLWDASGNIIGHVRRWMKQLYQEDVCPASGQPLIDCKECREGVSSLLGNALRGQSCDDVDWRTPPHAHEFLKSAIAALNESRKVLLL